MIKKTRLEKRLDLFKTWKLLEWFDNPLSNNKKSSEKIFKIWLKLFMGLYDDLSEKIESTGKRDSIFLHFVNDIFTEVIDVYKWFESQKQKKDVGLIKAMDKVSMQDWYIEQLSRFSRVYQ